MVKLHIKKGDESQFLYDTTVEQPIDDLLKDVCAIHNGRLKVQRICAGNESCFSQFICWIEVLSVMTCPHSACHMCNHL